MLQWCECNFARTSAETFRKNTPYNRIIRLQENICNLLKKIRIFPVFFYVCIYSNTTWYNIFKNCHVARAWKDLLCASENRFYLLSRANGFPAWLYCRSLTPRVLPAWRKLVRRLQSAAKIIHSELDSYKFAPQTASDKFSSILPSRSHERRGLQPRVSYHSGYERGIRYPACVPEFTS